MCWPRKNPYALTTIHEFCVDDSNTVLRTPYKIGDLNDPQSQKGALGWWEDLTGKDGERMVGKPYNFISNGIMPSVP
jgi:hypothetical protein